MTWLSPREDTSTMATKLAGATGHGSLTSLIPSWDSLLRAANKSPQDPPQLRGLGPAV